MAYDVLAAGDGRAMLYLIFNNYADGNLDVARELLTGEYSVPSLSDGGAHVGTICDASFPTTLLTPTGRGIAVTGGSIWSTSCGGNAATPHVR